MNLRQRGATVLIAILLIGTVAATPAAANPDIGIKAADSQGEPGQTVSLEVAVANSHEHAPAENIAIAVDTKASDLVINRTSATVSVAPEEVEVVTFDAVINESAEPGDYSVTAEVARGASTVDNATAIVSVSAVDDNRNSDSSDNKSPGATETVGEKEECTTIKDWINGEIEFGEWDHWLSCDDDDDDDSGFLDWFFD